MKFIMYIFFLSVMFLFNGCAVSNGESVTYGKFKKDYIGNEINPFLYKVDTQSVCIENFSKKLERRPGDRTFGFYLEIDVGEISSNVTKEFFEQYFNNVYFAHDCSNTNAFIKTKINVNDFRYRSTNYLGGAVFVSDITYTFFVSGKKVDKTILFNENNEIVIRFVTGTNETMVEHYHKALINELENQVKPILVNAL